MRYCKDTTYLLFYTLSVPGHFHKKWQYQFIENCDNHLHKKSTLSLTFILRYCKDFADLIFWVIWTCPQRLMVSTHRIVQCLSTCKKSREGRAFFFEILWRYYKLAILGTLGIPGSDQANRYYQYAENSDVYLIIYHIYILLFLGKMNDKIFKKM